MAITLKHISKPVNKTIQLPASKSISNRLLIIQALTEKKFHIKNLSQADDTRHLLGALKHPKDVIDCGDGGTTFRFLLAYYASKKGEQRISGSSHLMRRPVQPLVDALKKLGAKISVQKNIITIRGRQLSGGNLNIDASVSSQFISGLLLIAPTMKNNLELTLEGKIVSDSYIDLTIALMQQFGIQVSRMGKIISVAAGKYSGNEIEVESDWSAATYFYELAALNQGCKIIFKGLRKNSLQGDSVVAEMYEALGVKTTFKDEGVLIENKKSGFSKSAALTFNLKDYPDLFPALVITCAAKKIKCRFKNVAHLQHKESARASVFKALIEKMGGKVRQTKNVFEIESYSSNSSRSIEWFHTYNDHRVAMALAPLAAVYDQVKIHEPQVVKKSFPDFWKEFPRK